MGQTTQQKNKKGEEEEEDEKKKTCSFREEMRGFNDLFKQKPSSQSMLWRRSPIFELPP
jgi:hypothetical protein